MLHTVIHPLGCPCTRCRAQRDPMAQARAERVVRLQAAALLLLFAFFLGVVLAFLPDVLNAFGLTSGASR